VGCNQQTVCTEPTPAERGGGAETPSPSGTSGELLLCGARTGPEGERKVPAAKKEGFSCQEREIWTGVLRSPTREVASRSRMSVAKGEEIGCTSGFEGKTTNGGRGPVVLIRKTEAKARPFEKMGRVTKNVRRVAWRYFFGKRRATREKGSPD